MTHRDKSINNVAVAISLLCIFFISGCAPLLVAGGAAGGYVAAKDMEDGKLIDR